MRLVLYILKKVIPVFIGSVVFFALILNLVDLFTYISQYLQQKALPKDILLVMLYYTPKTIWFATPMGILFATSYTLSDLFAHNELEALFASGISLIKFTFPILIFSLFVSFMLFFFDDQVVVPCQEKKIELQDKLIRKIDVQDNEDVIVLSENSKIIYKVKHYNDVLKRLENAYFIFRDDKKNLDSIIYSDLARWDEDNLCWVLQSAIQYKNLEGTISIVPVQREYVEKLTESYEIFKRTDIKIEAVNIHDAKIYIEHLKKAVLPYQTELSEYYKKFAFPCIVFIVVFLAIGLTGKTKKNVLLISLASSVFADVLFYVLQMVTMIMASKSMISPFWGAWFPVFLFVIASIILVKFSRT
ncbi:MAG: YjgP/YjgQ family permease [Treponema sp.]|nr:YjgP/YjgQ family permease [Treponema sp.]